MIKLQDFAASKGVTDKAIYKHLQKHQEALQGHFEKRGKNGTWLDDFACEYISSLMISNPPVIGDNLQQQEIERLSKENDELKNRLIYLQDKTLAMSEEVASLKLENKDLQFRLETSNEKDKEELEHKLELSDQEKEEAQIQAAAQAEEARIQKERADSAERKIAEVEQAFAAEQQRPLSLMERLTGKRRLER